MGLLDWAMGFSPVLLFGVLQHNLNTGGAHFANSLHDDSNTTSPTHTAIAVSSSWPFAHVLDMRHYDRSCAVNGH
jgi:hypothetical protein